MTIWQSSASVTLFLTLTSCSRAPVRVEWNAVHRHSRSLRIRDQSPYVSAIVPTGVSSMLPGIALRTLLPSWRLSYSQGSRGGGQSVQGSVKGAAWRKSLEPYSRLVWLWLPGLIVKRPFHEVPTWRPGYVSGFSPPPETRVSRQTIGKALARICCRDYYRLRSQWCRCGLPPEDCTCELTNRFALLLKDLRKC